MMQFVPPLPEVKGFKLNTKSNFVKVFCASPRFVIGLKILSPIFSLSVVFRALRLRQYNLTWPARLAVLSGFGEEK